MIIKPSRMETTPLSSGQNQLLMPRIWTAIMIRRMPATRIAPASTSVNTAEANSGILIIEKPATM